MLTRRVLLGGAAALGATGLGLPLLPPARAAAGLPPRGPVPQGRVHELTFRAQQQLFPLMGADRPLSEAWTYGEHLMPVVRVRQGDSIRAILDNALPEHTTIHWHGVRVPNAMDGVQYVTQPPVKPGTRFAYEFTPPDTGTFFFHPHCNESAQVGQGLTGVLIVEGDEAEPSDADIVMGCKDWRLKEDGTWLPFFTSEGASRAGTFGTLRTVNAVETFTSNVPAQGDIRLRILNLDATRMMDVGVEGAEAFVIATDGNPVEPFALHTWRLGAAMRMDVLVRAPKAGERFVVNDYFAREPHLLGAFTAVASDRQQRPFAPRGLSAPSDIPRADLNRAERLSFIFSASSGAAAAVLDSLPAGDPLAEVLMDSLCVGSKTFWAINKATWPSGDHRTLPPPLGQLEAGKSYVFELQNITPHPHPIHLHGHTFEVLSASRQQLPRFLADTVLIQPRERMEIAFVAAPGNWMFHCHVVEHQEGGMMGWFKVA
jgi:FtsP/CotA-like multicopper oxidase with cupredoxin domain